MYGADIIKYRGLEGNLNNITFSLIFTTKFSLRHNEQNKKKDK